jgi:hypothetical protein
MKALKWRWNRRTKIGAGSKAIEAHNITNGLRVVHTRESYAAITDTTRESFGAV